MYEYMQNSIAHPLLILAVVSTIIMVLVTLIRPAGDEEKPKQAPEAVKTKPKRGFFFCPQCASPLVVGEVFGKQKTKCSNPDCDFVHWKNPVPVAVAVVPHANGGIVMIKRDIEPRKGFYALPGGFIDENEDPQVAAVREVWEETGLKVEIDCLLAVMKPPGVNQILHFYLTKPTTQMPKEDKTEVSEASVFALDKLPAEMAFSTHQDVINLYLQRITKA